MAFTTTAYTIIYAYFALISDEAEKEKIYDYWMWIILPLPITAIGVSFCLKPRRDDLPYRIFLYLQYFVYAYVSQFLRLIGLHFSTLAIVQSILQCVFYYFLLKFGMKCRSHIAKLSNEELSAFLTQDVVLGGIIIGLGQLAFLMFPTIQCDRNADSWRDCKRTLHSQFGLSSMVTLYIVVKLASGVVPIRILKSICYRSKGSLLWI